MLCEKGSTFENVFEVKEERYPEWVELHERDICRQQQWVDRLLLLTYVLDAKLTVAQCSKRVCSLNRSTPGSLNPIGPDTVLLTLVQ